MVREGMEFVLVADYTPPRTADLEQAAASACQSRDPQAQLQRKIRRNTHSQRHERMFERGSGLGVLKRHLTVGEVLSTQGASLYRLRTVKPVQAWQRLGGYWFRPAARYEFACR